MDNRAFIIDCEQQFGNVEKFKPIQAREYSYEEAITLTGVGRFHVKLLLICGLCFMAVMVELMGISLIMPVVKCDLQATWEQQGFLASAGFLGVVLSSPAMGFLVDYWGRLALLRYAMFLSGILSIVSAFSVNIWMLIVSRFLTGFFISAGQSCVFSLCGEFHGNGSRIRHVTLISSFMCIAMIFAPAVAIGILPLQLDLPLASWRLFLIANVSISLLALLGLFALPETPKYLLMKGRGEEALEILRSIYAQNSGRPAADYPVKRLAPQVDGDSMQALWESGGLFHRPRIWHTLNISIMQFIIYFLAQGIFMWFPIILNELGDGAQLCTVMQGTIDSCLGTPDLSIYQVMITIGAAFTIIHLIFVHTIELLGKRKLLIVWMILTIVCLTLLHWLKDYALVVIALTLIMGIGNCGGIVNTLAIDFYPKGMCFIMMIGHLGAAVGIKLFGQLLFDSCCDTSFWALNALMALLSVMAYFLPDQANTPFNASKASLNSSLNGSSISFNSISINSSNSSSQEISSK